MIFWGLLLALCDKPNRIHHYDLDSSILKEVSGIAYLDSRLYFVNDSGDGPYIYRGTKTNKTVEKFKIKNFDPFDVEDLAVGKCDQKSCFVVADIGDNFRIRSNLNLVFVQHSEFVSPDTEISGWQMSVSYPSGQKHNAESIAFHPSGDLYLLTKEEDIKKKEAKDAFLYRVPARSINAKLPKVELEFIKKIPLATWMQGKGWEAQVATAMDFLPTGELLILTYKGVHILNALDQDFKHRQLDIEIKDLMQAESLAVSGPQSFIVTSEVRKKSKQPLYSFLCKELSR